MLFKNMGQARKYRDATDDGDDGSGKDVKIPTVQDILNSEEGKKIFKDMVDAEVSGLKNKNSELLDKIKKAQETVKQFDGLDVAKLKDLSKQMETNEELRLFAEGKHDEVVNRRLSMMTKDFETQLASRDDLLKEREAKVTEYENLLKQKDRKLTEMVVDGQVRESYIGLDFEPAAMDDVMRIAHDVFKVDEDGKVIPRDQDGKLILGKDGKTPITSKEWLENLAEKKPYLRRPSKGGGAGGSGRSANDGADTSKLKSVDLIADGLRNGLLSGLGG